MTSGISVGSSSVSISTDSSLARSSSRSYNHSSSVNHETSSRSLSHDLTPSSSPDSEQHPYYDKLLKTTDITPSSSEPFYINADATKSNTHYRVTNKESSLYANEALTHHSTNILIHYNDSSISNSPSGFKAPTPTPRSSIISSIHCPDASTHIVQSYGPTYTNSHIINSLKRSKKSPLSSRPSSSLSYYSSPPTTMLREVTTPTINTYISEINNYSSLPRNSSSKKPITKSIGSQTNIREIARPSTTDITLKTNDKNDLNFINNTHHPSSLDKTLTNCDLTLPKKYRSSNLTYNSDTPSIRSPSRSRNNNDILTNGEDDLNTRPSPTNISTSSNVHWKIYNWDTGRNGETWSNSLCRTHLPQDMCNTQQVSTTLANTNTFC